MSGRGDRRPGRVYAIADAGRIPVARLPAAVAEMAGAGIRTIQLRAKALADDALWRLAEETLAALEGWPGELWIDDRTDLAAALPFAGVHLGQRDLPPTEARTLLGPGTAIACSTHDHAQFADAEREAAVDWVALGPIFATTSKTDPDPVVGLGELAALAGRRTKPLIAIGGVDENNLAAVLAAGADSVAVLSALCDGDVAANSRRLVAAAGSAG